MSENDANKEVVAGWVKALSSGDAAGLFAPLAENVTFVIPGSNQIPFAGTYCGIAEVQRCFGIIGERLAFGMVGQPRIVAAEGGRVIVYGKERSTTKPNNKIFESEFAWTFSLMKGKIVIFESYEDTEAIAKSYHED